MNLELFTGKGERYSTPRVSITSAGQIGLSSTCLENYFEDKKHVRLYGDKKKKIMGIKPLKRESEYTFKISYSTKGRTGSISGQAFLKYLNIDFSKCRQYAPKWNEEKEMLIVEFL